MTHFFNELSKETYHHALDMFNSELSRIKYLAESRVSSAEDLRSLFSALVHPREAVIRFGEPRARMAADPEAMVKSLFHYYVERDFVTIEYREQVLERRIRSLVHGLQLPKPFKAMELGDDYAQAYFPLVQEVGTQVCKAIKPFYLAQSDPSKIINHGGIWVDRIKRLRRRNLLPRAVMFAIDGPSPDEGKRFLAYEEICADLREYDIQVVPSSKEQLIVDFARA